MPEFTRRRLVSTSLAAAIGAGATGTAAGNDIDTRDAPVVEGRLDRFATTALGAEVTGPFVTAPGDVIFSLQHPSRDNPAPYGRAGIGYVSGFQFDFDGTNDDFESLSAPTTDAEQSRVRVAEGEYELFAQEGDAVAGGDELLGVPQTPDGTPLSEFAGSRYADFGHTPDMNQFVATNGKGTAGYLFTNWETSPGCITRMPLRRTAAGWEADLDSTENLVNDAAWREIGGTRINCYGDMSPWGTPLSAEEEYAHTRLSMTSTTEQIQQDGTGVGHRGAAQYWNRPDPASVQGALDDLYADDSWYVQGYWALGGVELLAYYLGADPVDQDGDANTTHPIGGRYPNPYRYGHVVEIREPAGDPEPVKHHAFGRAAWECPDVLGDRRTVLLTSDGDLKGLYKFVAERPIPSYDDPGDVRGTLSVARVTNQQAAAERPPADVDLELEWVELGTASNAEVASWIADYDYVSQVDYLETHAETDWRDDLDAALEEADRAVSEGGNLDYISDDAILEWASQRAERGPDGVDEELRRVPFLETRAAAKELDATTEFRKAEGVDSVGHASPGDDLYVGVSEVNDGMTDDAGDIRLQRVDGGLVYRATVESGFDVTTLEPVIVGPDASDSASVMDANLVNVDNVYAMRDGRVLLCEDADQFGRSFPNDSLWVYDPNADGGASGDDRPGARFPEVGTFPEVGRPDLIED